jgi:hypothetical protein
MGKFVFAVATLVAGVTVMFAAGPNNPANFELAKKNMGEMADKKMAILKDFKSCVDAATDVKTLKECKSKEMSAMKELRPMKKGGGKGSMDMNGSMKGMSNKSMM